MQRPWLMKDAQIDFYDSDINDWNYTYDNDRQIPKTRLMYNFNDNFHNNLSSFVNDICDKNFRGYTFFIFFSSSRFFLFSHMYDISGSAVKTWPSQQGSAMTSPLTLILCPCFSGPLA